MEFRQLVKLYLSKKFEVKTAENAFSAMAMIQNGFVPDIIVTDLMMPNGDGKTFIEQIKNTGAFAHIPVIVLSSIDKSSERISLLQKGAEDYILKPFNPLELEVKINKLLQKAA